MRYYINPLTNIDHHFPEPFRWAAIDRDGSLYAYENKPFIGVSLRLNDEVLYVKEYWSGGEKSEDRCFEQRDSYYPEWESSLRELTQ